MTPSSRPEDELVSEQALVEQQIAAAQARMQQATDTMAQADADLGRVRAQEVRAEQRITDLTAEVHAAHAAALTVSETLAQELQQEHIAELEHSLAQALKHHKSTAERGVRVALASQKAHRQGEQILAEARLVLNTLDTRLDQLQELRVTAHAQLGRTKLAEVKAALAARVLAVEEAQLLLDEATKALERLQRSVPELLAGWPELQEEVQHLISKPEC